MVVIPIINNGSVPKTCRYLFGAEIQYPLRERRSHRFHILLHVYGKFGSALYYCFL